MPDRRLLRVLTGSAALALALSLGACADGSTSSSSSQADTAAVAPGGSGQGLTSGAEADVKAADGTVAAATEPKLVKQAQVDMTVDSIPAAADELRSIATGNGGTVTNEYLQQTDASAMPSSMTLSVPADKLDATVDQVAGVGTVVSRSASTSDVTTQYVDTQARIDSLQRSVDRLRTLIDGATTVTDIAEIEAQLTQREADLDSLKAQMTALEGSVAQSTINVTMSTRPEVFEDESGGFLSGLRAGWRAFLASVGVLLTALGAILPFAVAAAVILVPLFVFLRRRTRGGAAPIPPSAGPRPSAGPQPPTGSGPAGGSGPSGGSGPGGMPPAPADDGTPVPVGSQPGPKA